MPYNRDSDESVNYSITTHQCNVHTRIYLLLVSESLALFLNQVNVGNGYEDASHGKTILLPTNANISFGDTVITGEIAKKIIYYWKLIIKCFYFELKGHYWQLTYICNYHYMLHIALYCCH